MYSSNYQVAFPKIDSIFQLNDNIILFSYD